MTLASHPLSHASRFAKATLALLLVLSAVVLAGCASAHPVTKSGEACASCHSDGRTAAGDPDLSSATETGLTFAIESGAEEAYLCTASVAEDGTIVPARQRTIPADEFGAVTVSAPGLYALAAGDIASPNALVLLTVSESGPENASVKL